MQDMDQTPADFWNYNLTTIRSHQISQEFRLAELAGVLLDGVDRFLHGRDGLFHAIDGGADVRIVQNGAQPQGGGQIVLDLVKCLCVCVEI